MAKKNNKSDTTTTVTEKANLPQKKRGRKPVTTVTKNTAPKKSASNKATKHKPRVAAVESQNNDPNSIEVTADNIDQVAAKASSSEQAEQAKAINQDIKNISKIESMSSEPQSVNTNNLLVYSDSIRDTCRNHFRAMSVSEIRDLMTRGNYPFKWNIVPNPANPHGQIYIDISDETNKGRIPTNPEEFIAVNG